MVLHQGTFEKNNLIYGAINIDKDSIRSNDYIKEGGGEGSGIFMLGFPLGLIDEDSLMPICRAGSIARITKSEIGKAKRILLDLQNFPGSSGSPIVSKPESYSVDGTKAFNCCKLSVVIAEDQIQFLCLIHPVLQVRHSLHIRPAHRALVCRVRQPGAAGGALIFIRIKQMRMPDPVRPSVSSHRLLTRAHSSSPSPSSYSISSHFRSPCLPNNTDIRCNSLFSRQSAIPTY